MSSKCCWTSKALCISEMMAGSPNGGTFISFCLSAFDLSPFAGNMYRIIHGVCCFHEL